ncbi:Hypothetical protein NTJ_13771 [Nesidiocoris tenuis]|uniref:Uncharacterized protein n=1 Tax=Nesidiocoris tenuis TaxID=355587 RepID=A0ABN7BAW8_9HEMI|nr:Hypothetical protein NTJ_13771 [Nesidiocoris tenuis]
MRDRRIEEGNAKRETEDDLKDPNMEGQGLTGFDQAPALPPADLHEQSPKEIFDFNNALTIATVSSLKLD